jgi:general secretion pathway protein C
MRETLKELAQGLREKVAALRSRGQGLKLADTLKSAGGTIGPMAQRGLLRLPGLDETFARLGKFEWVLWALSGVLAADLAMTGIGNYMGTKIPKGATQVQAPTRRVVNLDPYVRNFDEYNLILSANPFCPGCPIPDLSKLQRPKDCGMAKPLAGGSLKLVGTIVLSDPKYSVATIQRGSETIALQKGDNMSGVGDVYEIRQGRVCFTVGTGALQYIELPSDFFQFQTPPATVAPKTSVQRSTTPGIDRISDTEFNISRDILNKKLEDPMLLTEAYAVPHREDGELKGFKILTIKPGSVYESLGVQVGDIVTGVNGEPMNTVAKAQELFVSLRTQDKIAITVTRNGQDVTTTYSIR